MEMVNKSCKKCKFLTVNSLTVNDVFKPRIYCSLGRCCDVNFVYCPDFESSQKESADNANNIFDHYEYPVTHNFSNFCKGCPDISPVCHVDTLVADSIKYSDKIVHLTLTCEDYDKCYRITKKAYKKED